MAFISGIKKIFIKKKEYSSPSEYILTNKERESIALFFVFLMIIIINIGIAIASYQ